MRIIKAHPLKRSQLCVHQLFPFSHTNAVAFSFLNPFEHFRPPQPFKVLLRVRYVLNFTYNFPGKAVVSAIIAPKVSPIRCNPPELRFRFFLDRNIDGLVSAFIGA